MAAPAHKRLLFLFFAGLLLAGAVVLRFSQVDRRPFHADEAVQAYQTWNLVRGQGYTYDPADKHGPFLYYAAAGLAKISDWAPPVLNESRLRLVSLIAGLGTLALFAGSAARLGVGPALIATALVAVAPLAVIYDTSFIQEAWFCFFSWGLFFALLHALDHPTWPAVLLVGLLGGLMQATKETSVIHFAALGAAAVAIKNPKDIIRLWPQWPAGLVTATLVYVVFYSAGFTRWIGVVDGLRSYAGYAGRAASSPHDQPWYFYFHMLWPHTSEGTRWGEPLLLAFAAVGAAFGFTSRASPTHRATAVFTLGTLALYSVIPYKTPWLLLTPYAGLALLAGYSIGSLAEIYPKGLMRFAPLLLGLVLVGEAAIRDRSALGRYLNDARNPYVYQPTVAQFPLLVERLRELSAQSDHALRMAVVSPDHAWPLPWYLRYEPTTGYFTTPPPNAAAFDLVIYDSRLAASPATERMQVFGLRPNVLLWLARPESVREARNVSPP